MEIGSAISSLAAIKAIAGGLVSIRDESKVMEIKVELLQKVFDVQQVLLELQQENASLLQANRELQEAQRASKNQVAQLEGYEQFEPVPTLFVVAAKAVDGQRPKMPYYCQACYHMGKLSVLSVDDGPHRVSPPVLQCQSHAQHRFTAPRGYTRSHIANGYKPNP